MPLCSLPFGNTIQVFFVSFPRVLPSAASTKTSHFKEMRPILIGRLQIKLTCYERRNPYRRPIISE